MRSTAEVTSLSVPLRTRCCGRVHILQSWVEAMWTLDKLRSSFMRAHCTGGDFLIFGGSAKHCEINLVRSKKPRMLLSNFSIAVI